MFKDTLMKLKQRKWIVIFLVTIIAGGVWYFFLRSNTSQLAATNDSYTVARGTIKNTIKVLGTIEVSNQKTLTFGQAGKVTNIYVKEGDIVKKGDLLAELDKKDLLTNISKQQLSLENSKINYEKLLTQNTESDKLKAVSTYDDTVRNLGIAKIELSNLAVEKEIQLNKQESNIQELQNNINILKGNLDNGTSQTISFQAKSSIITAQDSVRDIGNMLIYIDEIYGITNANLIKNDNFELFLAAKDVNAKLDVKANFYIVSKKIDELSQAITLINTQSNPSIELINALQNKNLELVNALSPLVNAALIGCRASITSAALTQSTIDGRVSTLNGYNAKAISYLSTINSASKQLVTEEYDIQKNEASLRTMKIDKEKMAIDYNLKIKQKEAQIGNYEQQIEINKEGVNDIYAGPTSVEKRLQENSIKQQQLSLEEANNQYEDYEIRALFDGEVIDVGFDQFDKVSAEGITVQRPNIYEISVLIDQIDIVKLAKGQKAEIKINAYPNETFSGEITDISAIPSESAGVVSYTAKVGLGNFTGILYEGMTANVEITVSQKDNVIVIPSKFVQTTGQNTIVYIQKGNSRNPMSNTGNGPRFGSGDRIKFATGGSYGSGVRGTRRGRNINNIQTVSAESTETEIRYIILGDFNGLEYEVVSGLKEGDIIISKSYTTTSNNTSTKKSSSSGLPGAGAGGGEFRRMN